MIVDSVIERRLLVNYRADPTVVDGLLRRLQGEADPVRRRQYADALTRVYRKPGPWTYWGFRPPPRPPNTVAWERTEAIEQALDRALNDPDRAVRLAVLKKAYQILYRSGLKLDDALSRIEAELATPETRHLVTFVRGSRRGICRE